MTECINTFETSPVSVREKQAVRFLYNTIPGRLLLCLLVKAAVSKLAGSLMDSPATRVFIRGFIRRNNINIEEYRDVKYRSFNDFFVREINGELRPFPDNDCDVAAPCDGKLTAYQITEDCVFRIKNSIYSVGDLLQDRDLADEFINGVCLVFRLTPDDYHRYSYIDDGEILRREQIKGVLHTVRPISQEKHKVYSQNAREYTFIHTRNFGKVIQMEVGALFVGRIVNHMGESAVKRGDEKGMFQFGGSSVIMLFQEDSIALDEALYENTLLNKETIVRMGSKIGEKM